jgi:hypothetical protein
MTSLFSLPLRLFNTVGIRGEMAIPTTGTGTVLGALKNPEIRPTPVSVPHDECSFARGEIHIQALNALHTTCPLLINLYLSSRPARRHRHSKRLSQQSSLLVTDSRWFIVVNRARHVRNVDFGEPK